MFFETNETLLASDSDAVFDIYERQATVLTHISKGSSGGNGNFIASFAGLSQDGLSVFLHSNEQLESGDTDAAQDVYRATLPGYARPAGASPMRVSLVPAYTQCTAPNRVHGPPDFPTNGSNPDGSCNPPAQVSTNLTVGSPDAGGGAANFVGSVRLRALPGVPGAPEDSNVTIILSTVDVRCKAGTSPCGPANAAGGADYTGQLELRAVAARDRQMERSHRRWRRRPGHRPGLNDAGHAWLLTQCLHRDRLHLLDHHRRERDLPRHRGA